MKKIKFAIFALIPTLVLVVAAEFVARWTITRQTSVATAPSGERAYSLRIGRWPWSRRTVTPLNRNGFPDVDFATLPPKEGCVHVVLAGDSFFFGDGVDRDSSFIGVLKQTIAKRADLPCIRLFNLGERGTTIDRQAATVRETMAALRPDIVILGQYQNDLTDFVKPGGLAAGAGKAPDQMVERLGLFQPALVRWLSYQGFAVMIRSGIKRDVLRHWSVLADSTRQAEAARLMALYTATYDTLVTELRRDGVMLGAMILPSKFDILAGRFPEESFFVQIAESRRVPYLRVYPVLDTKRVPYAFLMYDGHLNEHGNRLVAEALERWLFDSEPAPFTSLRRGAASSR